MHALRIVPPSGGAPRAAYAVSASQLKSFDSCERAWYLSSVAKADDDPETGGQYLLQGDLYDAAGQAYVGRLDVDVESLIAAVRAKPGLRGAALDTPDAKWRELAERAQRMLRATQRFLPAPKSARIQHRYRVFVPGYEARGGVVITGATDFRVPGLVWDTKTTADRGPGRGRDDATAPYALNETTLRTDVQARLYAWCEFMLDPDRLSVEVRWVYASKASPKSPAGWDVRATFMRRDTLEWFDGYARPRLDRMVELHTASEIALDAEMARANHDGCARCFKRAACDPFQGEQALVRGEEDMVDFAKLRERQTQRKASNDAYYAAEAKAVETPDLESQLRASLAPAESREAVYASLVAEAAEVAGGTQDDRRADVAINRPDAPPRVLDTTGVELEPGGADAGWMRTDEVLPPPGAAETVLALLTPAERAAVVADPADFPGQPVERSLTDTDVVKELLARVPTAAPASDSDGAPTFDAVPRRRRGRPRKHPQQHTEDGGVEAPVASGTLTAVVGAVPALSDEALERLATAAQAVADAADSFVGVVNAELRARGVKL